MRLLRHLAIAGTAATVSLVGIAAPAGASPQRDRHHPHTFPVQLLSINDLHGNLEPPSGSAGRAVDEQGNTVEAGGAAYIATHLKRLRAGHRYSITVAAGDNIGASPLLSAAFHDEPTIEFLDMMGVGASSVGNHEFDEGSAELLRIQNGGCHPVDGCSPEGEWQGAGFPYLAANVIREDTGETLLPPYAIRTVRGVRVGFIGVVTDTTPSIVTAAGVKGLKFIDEVTAANQAARELKARGVQAIVLLLHEGDEVQPGERPDACDVVPGAGSDIATRVDPAIDMVLEGHTHQQYVCTVRDPAGHPRLYTQALSFGRDITEVDFRIDSRTKDVVRSSERGDNHVVTRDVPADPKVAAFVETWRDNVASVANEPVGEITADISRQGDEAGESPLGDLIADAQLEDTHAPDQGGAQLALMNPGGVRADLTFAQSGSEGDGVVTFGEAFTVQPFNNIMTVLSLTGEQLDALLEQQWQPQPDGSTIVRILQPSSTLHYTMDTSKPIGDRISNIEVEGQPVDAAATYRVACNNFLAGGGDGFTVFTEGTDPFNGGLDIDAFTAYLTAHSPVAPPTTDRITKIG